MSSIHFIERKNIFSYFYFPFDNYLPQFHVKVNRIHTFLSVYPLELGDNAYLNLINAEPLYIDNKKKDDVRWRLDLCVLSHICCKSSSGFIARHLEK